MKARRGTAAPVARGRNPLQVFALGCVLALVGRPVFKSAEVTGPMQILVNAAGLGLMLVAGSALDRGKARRCLERTDEIVFDARRIAK